MGKLTLTDVTNLRNEQSVLGTLGANNDAIEQAIEKTLSRDGTSPNAMNADLDMNSHRIINLPAPVSQTEPIRKADTEILMDQLAAALSVSPPGTGDVSGAPSAVDGEIVLFNGATGRRIKRATGSGVVHTTNGVYSASLVLTADISDNNVVYGKIQQANPVTLLGNATGATANVSEITLNSTLSFTGTTLQRAALTGDVAANAGSNTTTIANNAVTYAKMQDVSATSRILGRRTAGAGDTEECTLSQVLDFVGSPANGDILFRSNGVWTRLPIGSNNQVLTVASNLPSWASSLDINGLIEDSAPDSTADFIPFFDTSEGASNKVRPKDVVRAGGLQLLASGTVSAGQSVIDILLTPFTAYRGFKFFLYNLVPTADDTDIWMRFSTDGGSTYDTTNYSWAINGVRDGFANPFKNGGGGDTKIRVVGSDTGGESVSNVAAEGGAHAEITLLGQTVAAFPRVIFQSSYFGALTTDTYSSQGAGCREVTQDTDAVRFLPESGTFASGSWALYGLA